MMLGEQHGKYGGEWREGAETLITLSELARLENLALAAIREEASAGSLVEVAADAGRTHLLGDLEPRRVPDMGQPRDHRRRRPAGVPRAVHERCRRSQRQRARARASSGASTTAPCGRSSSRAPSSTASRELAKRDSVSDQHKQLLDRYVLDYELLQQATSADSDGEPDAFAA